jgi:hypothetical protein
MNTEAIVKRIAQLKAELDQVVAEANRAIGMRQGAIAELERLLAEFAPKPTVKPE